MIPSCFPWKVDTFLCKKHVNWAIISRIMIEWSWKIKFWKINYLFGYYVNLHGFSRKWIFQNLIFQVYPIITPLIMDQMTCSLPKNETTFHRQQDGIIHFCLSPIKCGVLAFWIYIFTKKIMDISILNSSTSFKLPKHLLCWDWDKNEWFHRVAHEN